MAPLRLRVELKRLALAATILTMLAPAAGAVTLDFDFNFENTAMNGGGSVTGVIRGLLDNATSGASSVEVLTNTAGFGIGEYIGNPAFNSWTVTSGEITGVFFGSFTIENTAPAVTDASLAFISDGAGLSTVIPVNTGAVPTFTLRTEPVAVIPLPAAGWLLLGGLGALIGVGAGRRGRAA